MRARLVVLGLAACTAACSLLLGLEPPEGTEAPAAPTADGAAPVDPCAHATPPDPPETDPAPSAAVPPFWLAMRASATPSAGRAALDLDGVCTCTGGPGSVADGGGTCAPRSGGALACDGPEGVDDALRGWLASFPATAPVQAEGEIARALARGERAVLLQIDGYNGLADDRAVTVGFAVSDGLYTTACDPALALDAVDAGCEGDSGFCAPTWRGCDRWHPAPGHVTTEGASTTAVRRAAGWVRGGVLVVREGAELPLAVVPGSTATPTAAATVLVGRLEEAKTTAPSAPRRFRLRDATLGARVSLTSLLGALHTAPAPGPDAGRYCDAPVAFQAAATELCKRADTAAGRALDLLPGASCDALSIGLPFEGDLVDVDPTVRAPRAVVDPCVGRPAPRLDLLCP